MNNRQEQIEEIAQQAIKDVIQLIVEKPNEPIVCDLNNYTHHAKIKSEIIERIMELAKDIGYPSLPIGNVIVIKPLKSKLTKDQQIIYDDILRYPNSNVADIYYCVSSQLNIAEIQTILLELLNLKKVVADKHQYFTVV